MKHDNRELKKQIASLKKKIDVEELVNDYACSIHKVKHEIELYKLAVERKETVECFHEAIPLLIAYENRKEWKRRNQHRENIIEA